MMTNILMSACMMLFGMTWSLCIPTVNASDVDPIEKEQDSPHTETEAGNQQRITERLSELTAAQAGLNRERSFTVQVLDEDGKPAQGVELLLTAQKYLRTILPGGKMAESTMVRIKTDQAGLVKTPVVNAARFHLTVSIDNSVSIYDDSRFFGSVEFLSDGSIFGGYEKLGIEPGVPPRQRRAPGIDWILYVHKFIGPHPLVEGTANSYSIPVDGTTRPWPLLHPIWSSSIHAVDNPEARLSTSDIRVRVWRDPAVPATTPIIAPENMPFMAKNPDGSQRYQVNPDADWWIELEAVHGGVQTLLVTQDVNNKVLDRTTAPHDGYADRVVIKKQDLPKALEAPSGHPDDRIVWLWWSWGGPQARFALIRLETRFDLDQKSREVSADISARLFINPTPGDRLIERPWARQPTWITDLTKDQALAWLSEPQGDPDPKILRGAPIEIGSP